MRSAVRPPALAGLFALLLAALAGPACSDSDLDPVRPPAPTIVFDPEAKLDAEGGFFDFPYPSDLRLTADGAPDLGSFPDPGVAILSGLKVGAPQRRGFPVVPGGYDGQFHGYFQGIGAYGTATGAITLSGGECLMQPEFSAALLAGAHDRGFTTAIETAGNVPWRFMEQVLPHVDTMLHDHKLTDPVRHKKWCGADNSRILANFKQAYETFPDIRFVARTPVIPGVNDDEEHIRSVLAFIRPHKNVVDYQLLPYFRFGASKYGFLGRVYELADFDPPPLETLNRLRAIIDEAFGRGAQSAPQAQ